MDFDNLIKSVNIFFLPLFTPGDEVVFFTFINCFLTYCVKQNKSSLKKKLNLKAHDLLVDYNFLCCRVCSTPTGASLYQLVSQPLWKACLDPLCWNFYTFVFTDPRPSFCSFIYISIFC